MADIEWLTPEELSMMSESQKSAYERKMCDFLRNSEDCEVESIYNDEEDQSIFVLDNICDSDAEEIQLPEYNASDSDNDDDFEEAIDPSNSYKARDFTFWHSQPTVPRKILSHNILRSPSSGPTKKTKSLSIMNTFKLLITPEICDIIIRETNRKAKQTLEKLQTENPTAQSRSWNPLTTNEFDAYLGILLEAGVTRSNHVHAANGKQILILCFVRQ